MQLRRRNRELSKETFKPKHTGPGWNLVRSAARSRQIPVEPTKNGLPFLAPLILSPESGAVFIHAPGLQGEATARALDRRLSEHSAPRQREHEPRYAGQEQVHAHQSADGPHGARGPFDPDHPAQH